MLHSAGMIARQCRGLAAACVAAVVFLVGCSSSGSSTPAVCTSVTNLKASVLDLKNVNVSANGISAISDQLTKIENELKTVKSDAGSQYSTQINGLSSALSGLGSSLTAAKDNPSGGTLTALASSAGAVVTAGNNLVSAVSSTC
jgi:hypothetical protein